LKADYLEIAEDIVGRKSSGILVWLFERHHISGQVFTRLSIEGKNYSFDDKVLFPRSLSEHLDAIAW